LPDKGREISGFRVSRVDACGAPYKIRDDVTVLTQIVRGG
jgi:hypothetical protein